MAAHETSEGHHNTGDVVERGLPSAEAYLCANEVLQDTNAEIREVMERIEELTNHLELLWFTDVQRSVAAAEIARLSKSLLHKLKTQRVSALMQVDPDHPVATYSH